MGGIGRDLRGQLAGLWSLVIIIGLLAIAAFIMSIIALVQNSTRTTSSPAPAVPTAWSCGFYNLSLTGFCPINVTAKLCKSGVMASIYLPFFFCNVSSSAIAWTARLPPAMDPGLEADPLNGPAFPSVPTDFADVTTVFSGVGFVIHQPFLTYPIVELGVPLTATSAYVPPLGTNWGIYLSFQLVYATNNTLALPTPSIAASEISIASVPSLLPPKIKD
jgi:hypothetical protein